MICRNLQIQTLLLSLVLLLGVEKVWSEETNHYFDKTPDFSMSRSIEKTEDWDRQVDQVALQSQDAAVSKLKKLIKKYYNTREESGLLLRLAEVYQESAEIEFRIAYAKANRKKVTANTAKYQGILKSQIEVLDRLVQGYPRFFAMDQILFMRAKSNEELKDKNKAKADYLSLVKNYPDSSRAIPGYMALAEMAITDNHHVEAISYLKEVEKNPGNSFYPFALYKMAWSYFNLKDLPSALAQIERHIFYYDKVKLKNKRLSASDEAIRENSLMDAIVFFTEAMEGKSPQYNLKTALEYFRKLEKGPLLGKMNLRYAKLLRSRRMDSELAVWKDQLLEEEGSRPETIDVVICVLEHQMNQDQFDRMIQTLADIKKLHFSNSTSVKDSAPYIAARQSISDAAKQFQTRVAKLKDQSKIQTYLKPLSTIYDVFIQIVPETDPRLAQSHYNLAEIEFQRKNNDQATSHYMWVVTHWNAKSGLKKEEVQLKAISSRYAVFRGNGWIPKELVPATVDQEDKDSLSSKLSLPQREWLEWIDSMSHQKLPNSESIDNFEFEANRAIYAHVSTSIGVQRLVEFSLRKPSSKYAVPSASLAIDTYIRSSKWVEGLKLSEELSKVKWKDVPFTQKLTGVSTDCAFKVAEAYFQAKDYSKAIDQAKDLQDKYPTSARTVDAILLVAQSYLALHQKENAQVYYSKLITSYPKSKERETALLIRAQLAEEAYDFKPALDDYESYLASNHTVSGKNASDLRKRVYFLHWLNGDTQIKCASAKDEDDESDEVQECGKYQAMAMLRNDQKGFALEPSQLRAAFKASSKGSKDMRALWSAVTLKYDHNLQLREQLNMMRNISKGWDKIDGLLQISLLPVLNSLLINGFAKARANMKKEVPLNRASAQAITRRAEWIKEYETIASGAISLPWSRIRSGILNELSGVYLDFSSTLAGLPLPKDMSPDDAKEYAKSVEDIVTPFAQKSKNIAEKAFQLASSASVEDDIFSKVVENNTESWKKLSAQFKTKFPQWNAKNPVPNLDLALMKLMDKKFEPSNLKVSVARENYQKSQKDLNILLSALWLEAFQKQKWEKTAFLLQEMKSKNLVSKSELKFMEGLTLVASGARAEGLVELKDATQTLEGAPRREMDRILFSQFAKTGSMDSASQMAEEMDKLNTELASSKSGGSS